MRRRDLEHIIRAAADIADDDEIIIIGSQAILGQYPDAPAELCVSVADVYPKNKPERADLIDGSIGEGSPFHDAYGYYAQGVGETTAVQRLAVRVDRVGDYFGLRGQHKELGDEVVDWVMLGLWVNGERV